MTYRPEVKEIADIIFWRFNSVANPNGPKKLEGSEVDPNDWVILWKNYGVDCDRATISVVKALRTKGNDRLAVQKRNKAVQTLLGKNNDTQGLLEFMHGAQFQQPGLVTSEGDANPAYLLFELTLQLATGAIDTFTFADMINRLVCKGLVSDPELKLSDPEKERVYNDFGFTQTDLTDTPVLNVEGVCWLPKQLAGGTED